MAFDQQKIEEMAAWCGQCVELATERQAAWQQLFAEDEPRLIQYWPDVGTRNARERRFLGYFLFDFALPSGEKPAEVAARRLYTGSLQAEARKAVTGTRFVLAIIMSMIGRSVFLELEDERFEVRSPPWTSILRPGRAIVAHLVPVRHHLWLPGPGWLEWPIGIGSGVRASLKHFQFNPIQLERLLQQRREEKDDKPRPVPPQDDTLEAAVERMTTWAQERGNADMVLPVEEWQRLVLEYLPKADFIQFIRALTSRVESFSSEEELNVFGGLVSNIWNNVPQPDRGGRTANEMVKRNPPFRRSH